MNIAEFRKKYPDYNDLSDTELAQSLHQKFYSDMPFDQFSKKFGVSQSGGVTGSWANPVDFSEMAKPGYSPFPKPTEPGFERDILPIASDIAMTIMPGPFGKAKAATTLGKLGLGAAKTLFKSGQAAAGSAGGEVLAQKEFGEEFDIGKVKEQALWGAIGEGVSRLAAPVFKPIFKWASDLTLSGASIKGAVRKKQERLRKQLIADTAKKAEEFVKDIAPDIVKRAGAAIDIDDLGVSVSKAFDETRTIYDVYGKHIDALKKTPDGGVIMDDTQQLLYDLRDKWVDEIYEQYDLKRDIKETTKKGIPEFYAVTRSEFGETKLVNGIKKIYGFTPESKQQITLLNLMRNEVVSPRDLKDLVSNMFRKGKKSDWGNLTTAQRTARDNLKETILGDIVKESPQAVTLLKAGDKAWAQISKFNEVQKIYNSALRDMPSGDKYLNPTKLWKKIYQSEKTIKENMPDLWPKLKAEADYYKEVAHNWRPPEAVQSAAEKAKPLLQSLGRGATPSAAAAIALGPEWMLVYEGFGMLSAWMTLRPGARKMLGEIVKNTMVKPAAHIGGPMALPDFGGP